MLTAEKRLNSETISPNTKRHKPVTHPELELALKEFLEEEVSSADEATIANALLLLREHCFNYLLREYTIWMKRDYFTGVQIQSKLG
ncbi:hypothetical protein RhiirC2_802637 [Rhizophagus irregularis]|uniref:Uncharacterized protein n=1 Tax=Rhizophagus irregularis TaxID=588596 RepID=A0A2N1M176_9GLOM|nr:hypothetical protein RhiirC2_802637 [Rhizophagus irregularis]